MKTEQKYWLTENGYRILDKPLTLEQITDKWGSVQEIEAAGYTLVPA